MRLGCTVQKAPLAAEAIPPEHSRGRKVKGGEVALRDEKRDAADCQGNRNPFVERDGAALRIRGPPRHEKRSRRDGKRRRRGVGVPNREKEGELNPEHPEGVEDDVASVLPVTKGGEDVFPQDEGFKRQKKHARARETKRRKVDCVERHRFHEVLRRNAHGTPEDTGGGREKNADHGTREHRKTSKRKWKRGRKCGMTLVCQVVSRGANNGECSRSDEGAKALKCEGSGGREEGSGENVRKAK